MKLKKFLLYIVMIFMLVFSFLEFKVVSYKDTAPPKNIDAVLILGYSLDAGILPSEWLVRRLESGLSLYEKGYVKKIIVSGGKGPKDKIPVSVSMKKWLTINGVDENHIITEELAKNTFENFLYSKKIADENNIFSIIVVSNDFHMYRSLIVGKAFFSDLYGYSTKLNFDLNKLLSYLKEPLSIMKYYIVN